MDENTSPGTTSVSPVTATDPDGDPLTYSLQGAFRSVFDIEPTTGQLKTKGPLDRETKASYTVTVRATDRRGLRDDIRVTISIGEEDEPPVFPAQRRDPTVEENQPAADGASDS